MNDVDEQQERIHHDACFALARDVLKEHPDGLELKELHARMCAKKRFMMNPDEDDVFRCLVDEISMNGCMEAPRSWLWQSGFRIRLEHLDPRVAETRRQNSSGLVGALHKLVRFKYKEAPVYKLVKYLGPAPMAGPDYTVEVRLPNGIVCDAVCESSDIGAEYGAAKKALAQFIHAEF